MATKTQVNRFREYHEHLRNTDSAEFKSTIENICQVLGMSERSYYRKLEMPQSLSSAEKVAIANVYGLPIHFIFPEMEQSA